VMNGSEVTWQWVVVVMSAIVAFFAALFTHSQMNRMAQIEMKVNKAVPRDEFNHYVDKVEKKLDAMREEQQGMFRELRREHQEGFKSLREALDRRDK
jgi:uncharacterized membrane protein (DUF106 family)